ncbi:uncharacterized protein LOC110040087 [Orbicella faveolata]|uniref:uncharacterized protein LOC110040087 n=1 Tax=Orbicella faveolata TaxID=48498 RepID=UPI0009E46BAF|nr:uncharacterized protein LOC110040087 [Orbicella faveolata]
MYNFLSSTLLLLLVSAFVSDRQVSGKCGKSGIADTDWAACLVAEDKEGNVCPHNFRKLEDDFSCEPSGSRNPPYKKRVCCLLGPVLDLQVKNSPCLAGTPSGDEEERKTHTRQ